MLLINKLANPGGIKRAELRPEIVRVVLKDGRELVYRLTSATSVYRDGAVAGKTTKGEQRR